MGKMTQIVRCDWRCILQAKFPRKPYNKSFIDQVCLFYFCEYMDLDFVSVHKHAKKELGQYPAILTSHLVNNPYIWHITYHSLTLTQFSFQTMEQL